MFRWTPFDSASRKHEERNITTPPNVLRRRGIEEQHDTARYGFLDLIAADSLSLPVKCPRVAKESEKKTWWKRLLHRLRICDKV